MIALFPTSGMTISWTMLNKGNVAAAIKITAISLIVGSVLAPVYLSVALGTLVEIDLLETFLTIAQIVILPMILGSITNQVILKFVNEEDYKTRIKPIFPALSVWPMLFIIFSSISMKANAIASRPDLLLKIILIPFIFYVFNFLVSTIVVRLFFNRYDGYALVYGSVMRNLSIALGLAMTSFGADTALIITVAFILQVKSAAWFGKLSSQYNWLENKVKTNNDSNLIID